jgi:hypothetical protein
VRAIQLQSRVEKDHTLRLRLPEDILEGPAEVIVLVPEQPDRSGRPRADELDRIALHCSRLPRRDSRAADEIGPSPSVEGVEIESW